MASMKKVLFLNVIEKDSFFRYPGLLLNSLLLNRTDSYDRVQIFTAGRKLMHCYD